jgi:hypothetical protein
MRAHRYYAYQGVDRSWQVRRLCYDRNCIEHDGGFHSFASSRADAHWQAYALTQRAAGKVVDDAVKGAWIAKFEESATRMRALRNSPSTYPCGLL